MIRTAAVVGAGLIGTSVALALTGQGVTVHLIDRDLDVARAAERRGAGTTRAPDRPVDLAVLAVPPSAVGAVLAAHEACGLAAYYTDVASTKTVPMSDVARLAAVPARYVGGHPMAGGERSGPTAARGDLFRNRKWVLTPVAGTDPVALRRARELVELCGATSVLLDSTTHDEAVAATSHLPHLVSSLLAARFRNASGATVELVGAGLGDVLRIAGGDPHLWTDIVRCNAEPVGRMLAELQRDLAVLNAALGDPSGGADRMTDLLDRGVSGRARVIG